MDFPIQIKAIRMGLSIIYFKGHRLAFPNNDVFLSLRIAFLCIRFFTVCQATRLGVSQSMKGKSVCELQKTIIYWQF